MASGVIKKWFGDKAFGFIRPDDGGDDVFVHVRSFPPGTQIVEGMRIGYDLGKDPRSGRLRAVEARVL